MVESIFNPQAFYGVQPSQGPGSYNYQPTAPLTSFGLTGSGSQYIDSMAQYGLPQQPTNLAPQTNWGGIFQNVWQGAQAFTSLASIYGMLQNLGLQKKAFKFAQEGTKRNFNAQAVAFNENQASKETARRVGYNSLSAEDQAKLGPYGSVYGYGTGQRIETWS